jgi:hypothetical protein
MRFFDLNLTGSRSSSRAGDRRGKPWLLADDPKLELLQHDFFSLLDLVSWPDDEHRGVRTHSGVLVTKDDELVAAAQLATLAEDRHPVSIERLDPFVDTTENTLVFADSSLALIQHARKLSDAGCPETSARALLPID